MKVSVGRDSENSLKIVTVPLKSGLLATMWLSTKLPGSSGINGTQLPDRIDTTTWRGL